MMTTYRMSSAKDQRQKAGVKALHQGQSVRFREMELPGRGTIIVDEMATAASNLTFAQFQEQYARKDRAYEFWYGEAIPKSMPTVIHGLLQKIIMNLLEQMGYIAACEVDLRIEDQAGPRPDVIATRTKGELLEAYPTKAWDVVVEILSEDESYPYLKDKCRKYAEWGFGRILAVDPSDRSVVEWKNGIFVPAVDPFVERIWQKLDEQVG